jgi:hypothetical protein
MASAIAVVIAALVRREKKVGLKRLNWIAREGRAIHQRIGDFIFDVDAYGQPPREGMG